MFSLYRGWSWHAAAWRAGVAALRFAVPFYPLNYSLDAAEIIAGAGRNIGGAGIGGAKDEVFRADAYRHGHARSQPRWRQAADGQQVHFWHLLRTAVQGRRTLRCQMKEGARIERAA